MRSPRPGRWIARPRRSRWLLEWGTWGVVAFQMALHLGKAIVEAALGKSAGPVYYWTIVAFFVGVGLVCAARELLARRLREEDRVLVDGGFGEQFPVEVTIVSNGKRIGTDRGVLWFSEGLVGFSGKAASFVLAPDDVRWHPKGRKADGRAQALPPCSLVLLGAPTRSHLIVQALGKHRKSLYERLRHFKLETTSPDAERFWPPLSPYDPRGPQALACKGASGFSLEKMVDENASPRTRT